MSEKVLDFNLNLSDRVQTVGACGVREASHPPIRHRVVRQVSGDQTWPSVLPTPVASLLFNPLSILPKRAYFSGTNLPICLRQYTGKDRSCDVGEIACLKDLEYGCYSCTDLNSLCYNSFTGQGQLLWVRVACSTGKKTSWGGSSVG